MIQWMATALLAAMPLLLSTPAQAIEDSQICGAETIRQERLMGIPDRLLHAISLVESGRWDADRRETLAWPWTVMAEGEGRFLPTKAAAVAEVKKLQARGVRNIDVGCMQVNLLAHPDAFTSLDEAFEPSTNVAYAARFLVGLYNSAQNWATAGAYYHSQTPSEAAPYKAKLLSTWNNAKGKGDARVQLAMAEENQPPISIYMPPGSRVAEIQPLPPRNVSARTATAATDDRPTADRTEAKKIADAYRQARLEEYKLRRSQQAAMAKG
jgi:hypothetical protein